MQGRGQSVEVVSQRERAFAEYIQWCYSGCRMNFRNNILVFKKLLKMKCDLEKQPTDKTDSRQSHIISSMILQESVHDMTSILADRMLRKLYFPYMFRGSIQTRNQIDTCKCICVYLPDLDFNACQLLIQLASYHRKSTQECVEMAAEWTKAEDSKALR